MMSQNGQTHFKNVSDHFGTLCIKGLKANFEKTLNNFFS